MNPTPAMAALLVTAALLAACSAAAPTSESAAVSAVNTAPVASPPPVPQASAAAADTATRTAPVVPGRPGRVFIFAGVDEDCKPIAPPALSITRPPQNGDISFKEGQQTVLAATARGTCAGTKANGTGVYYTARAGATGTDVFTISAKMPTGETLQRTFNVTIAP